MRKFGLVLAAIGAIVIAAPSIASAETVVIKRSGVHKHGVYHDHNRRARAEIRVHSDNGWHRGWRHRHADKVVIIKKKRHHHHHHD